MALLTRALLWHCYPWPHYLALFPLASLGLCYPWFHYGCYPGLTMPGSVTPGLTMALLPLASLWLCYPRPHYGSVTPGLTMALLSQVSLWLCYPWPHYGSVTMALTVQNHCKRCVLHHSYTETRWLARLSIRPRKSICLLTILYKCSWHMYSIAQNL